MNIEAGKRMAISPTKCPVRWCRAGISSAAVFALVVMLSLGGAASGAAVGDPFPVADASGDELSPDIGGDVVVWEDRGGADVDVRGKSLETGSALTIPVATGDQIHPKTDGDFVVWEDHRNGPGGDVYAYDVASGDEIPVAVGTASQRRPDISGGKVVWEEDRGSGWKIHGFDLTSNAPVGVSETSGDKRRPAISGDLVVWESHPGTGLSDIVGKRLGSSGEFAISDDDALYEDTPDVSGSTVVWREEGPGSYDVYGKNLESGEEFEVCVDAADQHSPSISGKLVVWTDGRGSGADVFGLDVESHEEFPISDEDAAEDSPAIGGETIVWEAQRDGGTNFGEWDILASSLDANPATPENLSATGALDGVELSWTPNTEDDLDHYDVYRKVGGAFQKINTAPLITPFFADTDAPKGVVSEYEVRAVDGAGQSSVPASASAAALSNTSLTLAASAPSVVFGGTVDLSGSLASEAGGGPIPGAEVTLEKSRAGANDFEEVSTADTDNGGDFVFEAVAPRGDTDFRASFAGNPSSGFEPSVGGGVRVEVVVPDTSLSANVSPSVVNFGNAVSASGRLVSDGSGVGGRDVVLEARPVGATGFSVAGRTRTSSTGAYSFAGVRPNKHTHYRTRFAGEAGLKPSVSQAEKAEVRAVVSTSISAARVKVGKAVVVSGTVSPAHTGSVSVTIRGNGRAASVSDTSASSLNGSRYRLSYRPKKPGRYTVEVSFAGDGDHLGASGPKRAFMVNK